MTSQRPSYLKIYCLLFLFFLMWGCASGQKKTEPVPEWLTEMPQDDRYFYALGISGQTRNIKNAWTQAANRARAELGRTIVSHVSSKDLVVSTTRSEYSRQLIEILSDTELNYTEIIKRWHDRYGSYGPTNYFYVLVRMDRKSAANALRQIK